MHILYQNTFVHELYVDHRSEDVMSCVQIMQMLYDDLVIMVQ